MRTCPRCRLEHPDELTVCPDDGTPLVEPAPWPEGTVIQGKYRVVAKIGEDVICTVYKAHQLKNEQLCTLHVMSWGLACDPAFVKLFEQDALQRRKVQHAAIARVEGIGAADDGRPFIVMEYVAGQSLKRYIELEAPFAPMRACALAWQVASALDAAHALGMIHRDVKPDSIYLLDGTAEKIKLLGLGISKLREALLGDRFRTSPEAVIGTFQYLSPEQALGHLGSQLDGRADLYALGVVMYQMLTRELPFRCQVRCRLDDGPHPVRAQVDSRRPRPTGHPRAANQPGDAVPAQEPRAASRERPPYDARPRARGGRDRRE